MEVYTINTVIDVKQNLLNPQSAKTKLNLSKTNQFQFLIEP